VKTESEIRQKLKQVLYRYRQKRLKDLFKKTSFGCRHHAVVPLSETAEVGVCGYRENGLARSVLCDARFHDDEQAHGCPFWDSRQTKEDVKAEFKALLASKKLGPIAANFPDAAALMWVLEVSPEPGSLPELDPEPEPEPEEGERSSWWRSLWKSS